MDKSVHLFLWGHSLMFEHTAMFPAMLLVMILRRGEYCCDHHHRDDTSDEMSPLSKFGGA